jgi:hypothetical protein
VSGRRNKKIRQAARRVIREDYFALYNTLCAQPFKRRAATAWRILTGRKLKG